MPASPMKIWLECCRNVKDTCKRAQCPSQGNSSSQPSSTANLPQRNEQTQLSSTQKWPKSSQLLFLSIDKRNIIKNFCFKLLCWGGLLFNSILTMDNLSSSYSKFILVNTVETVDALNYFVYIRQTEEITRN